MRCFFHIFSLALFGDVMAKRLEILQVHLTGVRPPSHFTFDNEGAGLAEYRKRGHKVRPDLISQALEGDMADFSRQCIERASTIPILSNTLYHDMSRASLREIYVRQILAYWKANPYTLEQDHQDSRKLVTFLGGLWGINQGLAIRLSVHMVLYGDSIKALGTEKHLPYLERCWTLKDYGSFALTELGHGSNASGVETTAIYDHSTREFILNTPVSTAAKWWIGAVGKTANMSVVFAQLSIGKTNHGVHVFLVPIRDYETHEPLPGVTLGDCGPKMGCHGIDNGFIIFNNYRVPYDALLDKFSHLSLDGKLKTSIKNKEKRFSAMLGALTRGRYGVSCGALMSLRNGLTVALRYAANRVQFGPQNKPEISILDYPLTRFRLMPHLASLFAVANGMILIGSLMEKHKAAIAETPDGPEAAEVHAIMSICKPLAAWYSQKGLQECREFMAGHGYSSFSGVPTLLSDNDVNNTWEGENNVLLQQTARYIFKNLQRIIKGQAIESEFVSFLTINGGHAETKMEFTTKAQLTDNFPLLRKLLEHRTQLLVRKSMTKLQENAAKYQNMFETWNNTQVFHMHALAVAFGEMVIANELSKRVEATKAQCPDTGFVLSRLYELFVASRIVGDLGTFREGDYLNSDQGNLIRDWMVDLSNETADSSMRVIDAIALPDKVLGSAFGVADGRMYRAYADMVESAEACYQAPSWVSLIKESRKAL